MQISRLDQVEELTEDDLLVVVQGGNTKQGKVIDIAGLIEEKVAQEMNARVVEAENSLSGLVTLRQKIWTPDDYAGVNSLYMMWDELGITDPSKIASVEVLGNNISSTSNFQMYMRGLNPDGSQITSGYLGALYHDLYSSGSETASNTHNSNNGWIRFPGYASAYSDGQSYGDGMSFHYQGHPFREGSYGGHHHLIHYMYQQSTSYNYPNSGRIAWDNYATSAPPVSWDGGIELYLSSGSFKEGRSSIEMRVSVIPEATAE